MIHLSYRDYALFTTAAFAAGLLIGWLLFS